MYIRTTGHLMPRENDIAIDICTLYGLMCDTRSIPGRAPGRRKIWGSVDIDARGGVRRLGVQRRDLRIAATAPSYAPQCGPRGEVVRRLD